MGALFVRRRIGAVAASGSDVSTDVGILACGDRAFTAEAVQAAIDSLTAGRTSKEWVVVLGQIDMRLSRGLGVHIDNRGDTSVRSRNIRIDNVFVSGASSHAVET